jgi:2-keto-4-pentenoate hydratase
MTLSLDEIAERQWRDYRARTPGLYFAGSNPALDIDQAYCVQQAVSKLRIGAGDEVIGYKVGCTGPGIVEQFGMAGPIRGCLYRSEIRQSGAMLDSGDFAELAIEGEMALVIGPKGEPIAAFPVIELHNFVFRAPRKTLVELVANNGLNAGIVLPGADWLLSQKHLTADGFLTVHVNDRLLSSGSLWPLAGGPNASLSWLRHHLSKSGLALAPGQIVLAGTALGLYPVTRGDHVTVCIDGTPITKCLIAR